MDESNADDFRMRIEEGSPALMCANPHCKRRFDCLSYRADTKWEYQRLNWPGTPRGTGMRCPNFIQVKYSDALKITKVLDRELSS